MVIAMNHGDEAPQLRIPAYWQPPLSELIDYLAAALCFRLQPYPGVLVADIVAMLKATPPKMEDFKYIREQLPLHNVVLTECITSYLENRGKTPTPYTGQEILTSTGDCSGS